MSSNLISNVKLSLWQKRNYSLKKEQDSKPSEKSQNHLANFFQLSFEDEEFDDPLTQLHADEELNKYCNIIDESEQSIGVDNYGDEALSLAPNLPSEISDWKSSLSSDTICQIPYVNKFINKEEKWHQKLSQNGGKIKLMDVSPQLKRFNFHKTPQSPPINNWKRSANQMPADERSTNQMPDIKPHYKRSNEMKVDRSPPAQQNSRYTKKRKTEIDPREKSETFRTARDQLAIDEALKGNRKRSSPGQQKKSLGSRPRGQCYSKFIPPNRGQQNDDSSDNDEKSESLTKAEAEHPKLKGIEPALVELIKSEIMDHGKPIDWNDIAGLEYAKTTIKEIVIWPMLRPDLFTGLRGPPKGILLFGPPGTGKTLIGKCIASQSGATFFSISASSLTSKWIGQGEKMVRALFAVAEMSQPAVIFIDEIDSLLSQRSESEHESSRRIKTEFLIHLDGATTSTDDRILVVGATNRPQEIDEAARRRLVKRLYIPLPDADARKQIILKLLTKQTYELDKDEIDSIVSRTDGYSGADVTNLCKEAALGPIRSLRSMDITRISKDDVRPIHLTDFDAALEHVKSSVSSDDLTQYLEWNKTYGCGTI